MSAALRLATQLAPALPRWLWLRAMTELSWRLRSTLYATIIIAAGTLAASQYGSIQHHCAISPNSGSEYRWGISLTQDSRDSDFYSGCQSNTSPLLPTKQKQGGRVRGEHLAREVRVAAELGVRVLEA